MARTEDLMHDERLRELELRVNTLETHVEGAIGNLTSLNNTLHAEGHGLVTNVALMRAAMQNLSTAFAEHRVDDAKMAAEFKTDIGSLKKAHYYATGVLAVIVLLANIFGREIAKLFGGG